MCFMSLFPVTVSRNIWIFSRLHFEIIYFSFHFTFVIKPFRVVPDRSNASCVWVFLRWGRGTARLHVIPTPSVSQTCSAPRWRDAAFWRAPGHKDQRSAFPLRLCKPRTSLCLHSTSFAIHPLCSVSCLSCVPGHSAEGAFKGSPFPHVLSQHLAQESLSYSVSSYLVAN